MSSAQEIAKKLTKAQRKWLTTRAYRPGNWSIGVEDRLHTYPPRNTHSVLTRLGLVGTSGRLSDDGLVVRALLLEDPRP